LDKTAQQKAKQNRTDLSSEDGWEATVAESALVQYWRWVFVVERKTPASTLALQRSSQ